LINVNVKLLYPTRSKTSLSRIIVTLEHMSII
jgi:hypothetical protein